MVDSLVEYLVLQKVWWREQMLAASLVDKMVLQMVKRSVAKMAESKAR